MVAMQIGAGLMLGTLAAWVHLSLTAQRARWAVEGASGRALASLPVGVGVPVALLFLSVWIAPVAGAVALVAFWLGRRWALVRAARSGGSAA